MLARIVSLTAVSRLMLTTLAIRPPAPFSTLSADTPLIVDPISDAELNASSFLNASNLAIACFDTVSSRESTTMPYYFDAVQKILTRDDCLVSRQFVLGPTSGDQWKWTGGPVGDRRQCVVVLASRKPVLTYPFPIILVAHVAALVAEQCITEGRGYTGGWAYLGPGTWGVGVGSSRVNPR